MTTTQAMRLIVAGINFWLAATGSPSRVAAADIVVTHRRGVWFLAFQEVPPAGVHRES